MLVVTQRDLGKVVFRFAVDPARRRLWISSIRRRKADSLVWGTQQVGSSLWKALPVWSASSRGGTSWFYTERPLGISDIIELERARDIALQEEARQGSSDSPLPVWPRIRRFKRGRERCRRPNRRFACSAEEPAAKANGKRWKWQRCVQTLSSIIRRYACSSSLDAESTTDHSHQDHSRRHQAQPSQQLSTSKSRDRWRCHVSGSISWHGVIV